MSDSTPGEVYVFTDKTGATVVSTERPPAEQLTIPWPEMDRFIDEHYPHLAQGASEELK